MTASATPLNNNRLESLDILRGFTLFMLVFFQPVLTSFLGHFDNPIANAIYFQFEHEVWHGFRLWDMVMPMFMFMAGTSMPYSLSKYIKGNDKSQAWSRIIKRVLVLWFLGLIVQGNLLALDPKHIYFYTNTLQAIASGYLIASLILLYVPQRKWQITCTIGLLILFWLPMIFVGDYTPEGNFAEWIDNTLMERFRDGVWWDEQGIWHFSESYTYTWIWSSINFGATVMLGALAGSFIKQAGRNTRLSLQLAAAGACMVAVALLLDPIHPINKRIWSSSMVLYAGGFSYLALAFTYYIIDCKGRSKGLRWLKYYGCNSIAAYMIGEVISFSSVVKSVSHGLEQFLGEYYHVWITFGNFLILFFILQWMYRNKLFFKA